MATTQRTKRTTDGRSTMDAARAAVGSLSDAADELEAHLASAAEATGSGVRAANDDLRRRSDVSLGLLGSFSVGLTAGLLLGGANRVLVAASLIPAALIGGVVLERIDRPRRGSPAD